jgi:hypothetical protein
MIQVNLFKSQTVYNFIIAVCALTAKRWILILSKSKKNIYPHTTPQITQALKQRVASKIKYNQSVRGKKYIPLSFHFSFSIYIWKSKPKFLIYILQRQCYLSLLFSSIFISSISIEEVSNSNLDLSILRQSGFSFWLCQTWVYS